jgi:hypothetical protein
VQIAISLIAVVLRLSSTTAAAGSKKVADVDNIIDAKLSFLFFF